MFSATQLSESNSSVPFFQTQYMGISSRKRSTFNLGKDDFNSPASEVNTKDATPLLEKLSDINVIEKEGSDSQSQKIEIIGPCRAKLKTQHVKETRNEKTSKVFQADLLNDMKSNETIQMIHSQDKEKIIKMNENIKKLKKGNQSQLEVPARSPGRKTSQIVSPMRIFQRQNSRLFANKPQTSDVQSPTQTKIQVNSNNQDQFIEKYKLAHEQLAEVSSEDFFKCVQKFERKKQYSEYYQQEMNIYLSLIQASEENSTLPKFYNLQRNNFQSGNLNVSKNLNHKKAASVFSKVIRAPQFINLQTVNLSHTPFDSQSLGTFFHNVPKNLSDLNLENCQINLKSIDPFLNFLKSPSCIVQNLNLQKNMFGDKGAIKILDILIESKHLQSLNLSNNKLTMNICEHIAKLLKKSLLLSELYLSSNLINHVGGSSIFKSLLKNTVLKVLDLSYNILGGRNKKQECAEHISKFIMRSNDLIHLDISNNWFTVEETEEIRSSLLVNQTIYGFHFENNQSSYVVNKRGFLIQNSNPTVTFETLPILNLIQEGLEIVEVKEEKQLQVVHRHWLRKSIQGVSITEVKQALKNQHNLDTCWICEGWQEINFSWTQGKSGNIKGEPLFLHLSFDEYKPMLMNQTKSGNFFLNVMCPPDEPIYYFFTNPVLGILTVAHEKNSFNIKKDFYYNGIIKVEGYLPQCLNYLMSGNSKKVIDKQKHYIPTVNQIFQLFSKIFSKPREEAKIFDFTPYLRKQSFNWNISKSIFNNYQGENEALLNECYEFDFESSKIDRLVKEEELDQIKETLRKYYKYFFHSYKFYASAGSLTNVISAQSNLFQLPCISLSVFYDFIAQTKILQDGKMRSTDLDINFISSNGKDLHYPQIFDKSIIRYQYMEIMVRIAIDKHIKNGNCKNSSDALVRLLEEDGIITLLKEFEPAQMWRDERLWNQQCDIILSKLYRLYSQIERSLPFLKVLFKYTTKLNQKAAFYKNPWVSAKDIKDLISSAGLLNENFTERDSFLAFLLSIQIQVDELFHARHYQMNFYEFIECLARIAEKISLTPPRGKDPKKSIMIDLDEKRQQNLWDKLDAFIKYLYYKLGDSIRKQIGVKDDQISEFDQSVIGLRKAKLRLQFMQSSGLQNNQARLSLNSQNLMGIIEEKKNHRNSRAFSSSSSSSSSVENSVEWQVQEYLLNEQVKPLSLVSYDEFQYISFQTNGNSNLARFKTRVTLSNAVKSIKNQKQESKSNLFSLVSILSYLKKKQEETVQKEMDFYNSKVE